MTVKEFAASLAGTLVERGIDRDTAVSNVLMITKTLSEDDLKDISEYVSEEEFAELSDSLAEFLEKKEMAESSPEKTEPAVKRTANAPMPVESMEKTRTVEVLPITSPKDTGSLKVDVSDVESDADMRNTRVTSIPALDDEPQEIILGDDSAIMEKAVLTPKAKAIFWGAAILSLPLTATLATLIFSLFALSVVAVCAFIVLTFAVVLAEVACGGAGFFVGIIYGIIKIVGGEVGTGMFEIGCGIIFLGVTLVLAYLTYGFAVKTLPYILKEVFAFWKAVLHRIGLLIEKFREECNRL